MTVAQIKQWFHVIPLFERLQEKWSLIAPIIFPSVTVAKDTAREISEAGELQVKRVEDKHIGYISLLLYSDSDKMAWWVNIRPVHFPGLETKVFDFNHVRYIEFEYSERAITGGTHRSDPSTYLLIKNGR